MTYTKPHLTYAQQLALLAYRGVTCSDPARAIDVLQSLGYYNFTGYLHPFRLPHPSGVGRLDQVRLGTTFEDVARLVEFDRDLRAMLLKGIQLVEVTIRARTAYVLGARDPFGHTTTTHLDPVNTARQQTRYGITRTVFDWWLDEYTRLQTQARTEPYVAHNLTKYGPPLPVWIACEFFDFGAVTRLYSFLLFTDRQNIATDAGLARERTLRSWLTTLNYVRKICAHNARLWNRVLIQRVQLQPRDLPADVQYLTRTPTDKVFAVITITAWLIDHLTPDETWAADVKRILQAFSTIPGRSIAEIGAPANWENQPVWKDVR